MCIYYMSMFFGFRNGDGPSSDEYLCFRSDEEHKDPDLCYSCYDTGHAGKQQNNFNLSTFVPQKETLDD